MGISYKDTKILFLGLDDAGKTTLFHMLKYNRLRVLEPILQANADELVIGKIKFKIFDLGGHETARQLWQDYAATVNGVIFIVDSFDRT